MSKFGEQVPPICKLANGKLIIKQKSNAQAADVPKQDANQVDLAARRCLFLVNRLVWIVYFFFSS